MPLVVIGLGLLLLLGSVLSWRAVQAGVEAVRGLTFTRPAPAQVVVADPRPDAPLQARVVEAASLAGGSTSVAVRDVASGRVAEVNADRTVPAASLFKLPIMVEVLKQQRLNRLAPTDTLEIKPEHWSDGSGVLQARVGERLTVDELLRLMIQESDNIASLVLLDAVGVENVNATMDSMGLTSTRLRDRNAPDAGDHVTSARDMSELLTTIASGRLIDPATSEAALRLLELKQAHAWLAEGLPWWVKVAHKWGDMPGARNDAGIVFTPRTTYVTVILTQGGRADDAKQVIAGVSRAAYEQLAQ